MLIDWEQIILIVLGSSVIATLVTKSFDWLSEKGKKKEKEYQKLYAPLKFYLSCFESVIENKNQIIELSEREIPIDEREWEKIPTFKTQGEYLKKIKEVLESNPGYIKKEHLPLVREFIKAYIDNSPQRPSKLLTVIEVLIKKLLP